jgi:hypothetical protein
MSIDRRLFLKRSALGVVAGALTPSLLIAAEKAVNPESVKKMKASYAPLKFDVAVVGAGPGGFPAAVAAARQGARVVLIEEDMAPGGAPVDMYVSFLCGGPRAGIFQEVIRELNTNHTIGGKAVSSFGDRGSDGKNHWWLPGSFVQTIYKIAAQEPNLTLMCGAPVVDVLLSAAGNRNRVEGVRIFRNGGLQDIEAAVTIDATGTGLVATMAGCEYMYGSEAKSDFNETIGMEVADGKVQPCTLMLISQRIKRDAVLPIDKLKGSSAVEDNIDHWVTAADKQAMMERDAGIYLHWGKTIYCPDTRDALQVAQAHREAIDKLQDNFAIWQEAGFAVHVAPKIGVREVRRVKGEYVLTANDIMKGAMPDDKVADAHYMFDVWGMKIDEKVKHAPPYGIPYRSLIPLNTEGLLTAGRIISATRIAHSSLRVQPICGSIGQAAGTAAALAAIKKTGVRSVDVRDLQQQLRSRGSLDINNKG